MTSLLRPGIRGSGQVAAVLAGAFVALAGVVAADYSTSYELNLSALYLLITLVVSWHCGLRWGLLFASLCIGGQLGVGILIGTPYTDPVYLYVANANSFFAILIVVLLASGFRSAYLQEQSLVRVDYLTGAANRKAFYECVLVEISRQRRENRPFAIAYMDCDHFKMVNDYLGHSEGDRVLRVLTQTIKANIRQTDLLARMGGDEFALVLSQANEFGALQAIRKLRKHVDEVMSRNEWPTTLSVGVGVFQTAPASVDHVVAFCDRLLHDAKRSGRNRTLHRVYDGGDHSAPVQKDERSSAWSIRA
jgi:diguanylate cyclase (GGDEF)-like protein